MKRIIIFLALSALTFLVNAQNFIDEVFDKYSRKDNITSIVINKGLLDFAFSFDNDAEKYRDKISDLRILVSENGGANNGTFTSDIRQNIMKDNYVSLIEILNGKSKVNLYIKKDKDKIVQLVMLATEDDEDVLLSLKGYFTMKDLVEIGKNTHCHGSFHHLSYLKDIDD